MRANTADVVEPAVDHERNAPLFQSLTQATAVAVGKHMIQDGGSQAVMLHENKRLLERGGCRDGSSRILEELYELHGNEGLILNDEDRAPSELTGHWDAPPRQGANCLRQGGLFLGPHGVPSCRSILRRATSVMIDCCRPWSRS